MSTVIAALTAEQVENLTGLSSAQLRDWDRTGFFAPSYPTENRRSPYSRVYSFEDVVVLRTLALLRRQERIPMAHSREVARALSQHSDRPWSKLTLYVLNREVHFENPTTGKVEGATSGQQAIPIKLSSIVEDMRAKAECLKHRDVDEVGKTVRHRYIAHNSPVIASTRIPVASVRSLIDAGFKIDEIVEEYPTLRREDVLAVAAARDQMAA